MGGPGVPDASPSIADGNPRADDASLSIADGKPGHH